MNESLVDLDAIASEFVAERERAAGKHGRQLCRDVMPGVALTYLGNGIERQARLANDLGVTEPTWPSIVAEEFGEALTAKSVEALRGELVQCGAMVLAWIEAIDSRAGKLSPPCGCGYQAVGGACPVCAP